MTNVLASLLRHRPGTATASRGAVPVRARVARAQLGILGAMMLVLTACSDAVVPPQVTMDRVAAARLMPAVTDARVRMAAGIQNVAIRDRVAYDLHELEVALSNGDANASQFRVRVIASVLADYKAQAGPEVDKQDVTGILLAMNAVTRLLGNETLTSIL